LLGYREEDYKVVATIVAGIIHRPKMSGDHNVAKNFCLGLGRHGVLFEPNKVGQEMPRF